MAKSELRLKARELRKKGESVLSIAKQCGVTKSTASLWVADIILSVEQLEKLKHRSIKGSELGRLRGSLSQKQARLAKVQRYINEGENKLLKLNGRELLIAGLAIYWSEGAKKKRRVEFCNSDSRMVQFFVSWLEKCFGIKKEEFICWVGINESHESREYLVREYWSGIIGIPTERFRKTSFKRVKSQKIYENHDHHFGTLYLSVAKSADLSYKILGLIEGLIKAA